MNYQLNYILNICDNSSVFYIHLFDVRLLEDILKKIEACRSIRALYS